MPEDSAHPADTPVTPTATQVSGMQPLIAQLHSVHFSPHMNTGLHPAGLCGQISIISKHLSVSNGLFWDSAVVLQSIVELMVAVTLCV